MGEIVFKSKKNAVECQTLQREKCMKVTEYVDMRTK